MWLWNENADVSWLVADFLQRLLFEFFKQSPLLLLLIPPQDRLALLFCEESGIWLFAVFSYDCYYF